MESFVGECYGGPENGKRMAHWQKTKKYFRPMVAAFTINPPVEVVEIGEYIFHQIPGEIGAKYAPYWAWRPTDAGNAMEKLFGPPHES